MEGHKKSTRVGVVVIMLLIGTPVAWAYSGGKDTQGGHFNRKTGTYHCHSTKCESVRGQSDSAL
jgi:hypothetical protein